MLCPVIDGKRQGIPLNMSQVYTNAEGTGGTGDALAENIFRDAKNHVDIEGKRLLQMQGKVMDGQYVNQKFIAAMNDPVMDVLRQSPSIDDNGVVLDIFWWPTQWDPGHWVNKVFSPSKIHRSSTDCFKELRCITNCLVMERCIVWPWRPLRNCRCRFV